MRRSKIINILCSVTASALFMLLVLLVLVLTGVVSVNTNRLVVKSNSARAVYSGEPLICEEFEIVSGELAEGHSVSATFSGIQTYAGESMNVFYVSILDGFGVDVTDDYDIQLEYGTLEMLPKPIKIISGSATKVYDGEPLTCPEWSCYPEDGLVAGHRLEVEVVGSITDVGIAMNTIGNAAVYNEAGKDVTANYELTEEYGMLTVTLVDVGGLGSGMVDKGGKLNLDGTIGSDGFGEGSEKVCYRIRSNVYDKVYLKLKSFGEYNGRAWGSAKAYPKLIEGTYSSSYLTSKALTGASVLLEIESLNGQYALPYYMVPTASGSTHNVQTSDVEYSGDTSGMYSVYYKRLADGYGERIYDEYEEDCAQFARENYLAIDEETLAYMKTIIEKEKFAGASLEEIQRVASYISSCAKYNEKYDHSLDGESNIAIAFLETYKEGICQHYATAATLLYRAMGIPARYTLGFLGESEPYTAVDIKGTDAHAWVEVYLKSVGWIAVEVTGGSYAPKPPVIEDKVNIILSLEDVEKEFDGMPLEAPSKARGFEVYQNLGYRLETTIDGVLTAPGVGSSKITAYKILSPRGEDVTDQFEVTCVDGSMHMYFSTLVFASADSSKVYDGEELLTDLEKCYLVSGSLEGDGFGEVSYELYNKVSLPLSDVGSQQADFDVVIRNVEGKNITECYKIVKRYGTLAITPRAITVKATDASKVYDGTPLRSAEYQIISGSLAENDKVKTISISGSQTEVGRSECVVEEIVIYNSSYRNITTGNYTITFVTGTLRVYSDSDQ